MVPGRGHEPPRRADPARGGARRARPPARRRGRASGRRSTRASWSSSAPTAARSSSPTAGAWRNASRSSSTSWPARSWSAPTTARSPASSGWSSRTRSRRAACRRIVATSSLELGIDMGAVDLVIQVESPLSVARGLQRIGRAGHQVGEPSRGVIFPKYRGDLLEAAVVTRLMHEGAIEPTRHPAQPARRAGAADRGHDRRPRLAARRALRPRPARRELRRAGPRRVRGGPRACWPASTPRTSSRSCGRASSGIAWRAPCRRAATPGRWPSPRAAPSPTAASSRSTSPTTATADARRRARERERRARRPAGRRAGRGDGLRGARGRGHPARRQRLAHRVHRATTGCSVSPAPGEPGKIPFWKGDGDGPAGRAGPGAGCLHARDRRARPAAGRGPQAAAMTPARASTTTSTSCAAANLLAYLDEEREATGTPADRPDDRPPALPRRAGRLADLPPDARSAAASTRRGRWPSRPACARRWASRSQPIWSDDGIVLRLPATEDPLLRAFDPEAGAGAEDVDGVGSADGALEALLGLSGSAAAEAAVLIPSDEVEELVVGAVGGSALFASRFRENAARALLLPRRRPGQRHAALADAPALGAAARGGQSATARFPIILETYRECLQDVFDLPALREHPGAPSSGARSRVVSVETRRASPFASSLLFDYIATYMYEGDAPLLDRRAQALALDRDLLRELLGAEELRELLDAEALAELELELQALTDERAAGSADAGARPAAAARATCRRTEVADRVRGAGRAGPRASRRGVAGGAGRRPPRRAGADRRGRGAGSRPRMPGATATRSASSPPAGVPEAFLAPTPDALERLARRAGRAATARSWPTDPATRWGLPRRRRRAGARAADGRRARCCAASSGPAASSASGATRRSCASCVAARWPGCVARSSRSSGAALARFLPAGRASAAERGGIDRLAEVIAQLEGLPLPASVLERDILPARVPRLPAAPARRARGGRRGRAGSGRGARARRWPDRPLPAGSPGLADAGRRRRPDARPTRRRLTPGCATSCWRSSRAAAPASTATCSRPPPPRRGTSAARRRPSGRCSMRSGTWSGRAW